MLELNFNPWEKTNDMKKIKAFIERADDGTYNVYIDLADDTLNYGIHGIGKTAADAVEDFKSTYEGMKKFYIKKKREFTEAEFEYHYDVSSFLSYYGKILSLAGLERLTGVNQGQLSHYVTGHRKPGKKTTEKIERKLHEFAEELHQVTFI
jgi:predicted RNase H-like HicB family nuclease